MRRMRWEGSDSYPGRSVSLSYEDYGFRKGS